jgi:hypothetical protein
MKILIRRAAITAVVCVATAAGGLLLPGTAQAQPVTTGSFSMSGDEGDYITGGSSYTYDAAAGDEMTLNAGDAHNSIAVSINAKNGDWWTLNLKAPNNTNLAPGVYPDATRYPFQGAGAGLSVSGNGRGCNELTGSFTVTELSFGPNGYVETLDATFEQHCEGGASALRGQVQIGNKPAPSPLAVDLEVATDGTFSKLNGRATLHGTVACSADATVQVTGEVTQVKKKVIITGPFSTSVACTTGAAVAWSATAKPTGTTAFQKGDVEVEGHARAEDPAYPNTYAEDDTVTVVALVKA